MKEEQYSVVEVRYYHYRPNPRGRVKRFKRKQGDVYMPQTNGGFTVCTLLLEDGTFGTGTAVCQPEDRYVNVVGRRLAYGYALEDALETRRFRSNQE